LSTAEACQTVGPASLAAKYGNRVRIEADAKAGHTHRPYPGRLNGHQWEHFLWSR